MNNNLAEVVQGQIDLLAEVVQGLIDLMWRRCPHWGQDWRDATQDEKEACARELALDIECQFIRLGNPYQGCSPKEYLAIRKAEQEAIREERLRKDKEAWEAAATWVG